MGNRSSFSVPITVFYGMLFPAVVIVVMIIARGERVLCNFIVKRVVFGSWHGSWHLLLFSTRVNLIIKTTYCTLSPAGFISDVVGAVLFPHHFFVCAVSIAGNIYDKACISLRWSHMKKTLSLHIYSGCLAMRKVKALSNLAWNWVLKSPDCRVSFKVSCCSIARIGNCALLTEELSIKPPYVRNSSVWFSLALNSSVTLKQNSSF